MGAVLERGCIVDSYSIVAAGSKVGKDTTIPAGQMWAGSPA